MERLELEALYALYLSEGIGNLRAISITEYFGSAEQAFAAPKSALLAINGIGEQTVAAFLDKRADALARARKMLDSLSPEVKLISYFDPSYPQILKAVYSPPLFLFVHGNAELLHRDRTVAIVGTRRMTEYGQSVTKEISDGLARAGVCIVSGLALGIDTCAHRAAFEAEGETIAVLGSGIDIVYPTANKRLAEQLIASGRGAVVSEFPLGTAPDAKNFPWRNRIVCGLARACVVIESDEKGGSMITAEIAQDQGRILYALPGDIYRPTSKGPNLLLASNRGKPVRNADDIVKDLGWGSNSVKSVNSRNYKDSATLTLTEATIVNVLDAAGTALHIDVLGERSGLGVQDLLVHLLDLEFRDIVRQLPGKYFSTVF
jgi:DNA processing protein